MATQAAKNLFEVLIGKTGTFEALATVQITDPTLGTFIDDGQVIVINADSGAVLQPGDDITDAPAIKLVQRSGATATTANLRFSNRIDSQNVFKYKGKAGVAAVELVKTLGYNGTTGSIDTTAATTFSVRVTYTFDESMWSEQQNFNYVTYQAATPTQVGIANSITTQLVAGVYPKGGTLVKVERLCNNAGATDGTATTATVYNGSKTIVLNAAPTTFVVGDYLRIGGGATTDAMYLITAISGTTVTLDCDFQGTSAAAATLEYVTAALAAAANWGIRFTGQPLTFSLDPYGVFKYLQMDFLIQPVGFGATSNATLTAKVYPTNSYELVAQMAAFAAGFEGAVNRHITPLPNYVNDAVASLLYDCITIQFADATDLSVISGTKPSLQDLYIFLADGAAQQVTLLSVLNPWMASTPNGFAIINPI